MADTNDVAMGSIPSGSILINDSGKVGGLSALTASRVMATNGSGAPSVLAAMTSNNPIVGAGDGTITSATWTDVYNSIKSAIEADFPSFTHLGLNYYTAAEVDTLLGDKLDASVHGSHVHSGETDTADGHTHTFTTGTP